MGTKCIIKTQAMWFWSWVVLGVKYLVGGMQTADQSTQLRKLHYRIEKQENIIEQLQEELKSVNQALLEKDTFAQRLLADYDHLLSVIG